MTLCDGNGGKKRWERTSKTPNDASSFFSIIGARSDIDSGSINLRKIAALAIINEGERLALRVVVGVGFSVENPFPMRLNISFKTGDSFMFV